MVSRCCRASICVASSFFSVQTECDYYICTYCFKPCDTMFLDLSRKDKHDKQ